MDTPAPRNREQISAWWKRNAESSKNLEAEVTPIGIAVQGDTAVAHYYYSQLSEDKEGERETDHGRYTDVLIKEDGTVARVTVGEGDDAEDIGLVWDEASGSAVPFGDVDSPALEGSEGQA